MVLDMGPWVWGVSYGVLYMGCRVWDVGCLVLYIGYGVLGVGCLVCHLYSAASKNIKVNLVILHEKRKVK